MFEEIDADDVCDDREPDDEDDDETPSPIPRVKPLRFVLGERRSLRRDLSDLCRFDGSHRLE